MLCMKPLPWYIFKRGLQLCTLLLLLSFIALLRWGGDLYNAHFYYDLALSLNETAQAVLLLTVLISVVAEDMITD